MGINNRVPSFITLLITRNNRIFYLLRVPVPEPPLTAASPGPIAASSSSVMLRHEAAMMRSQAQVSELVHYFIMHFNTIHIFHFSRS